MAHIHPFNFGSGYYVRMVILKQFINAVFLAMGVKILKIRNYENLVQRVEFIPISNEDVFEHLSDRFLDLWPVNQLRNLSIFGRHSHSQLGQDLIALQVNNFKINGYFVEIGAADGVHFSNTYLLEKNLSWKGLCVEPAKGWHADLLKSRKCFVDLRAVWNIDGDLVSFKESEVKVLSTLSAYTEKDLHAEARAKGTSYQVETITLNSLLREYKFPKEIDYLSIDTEGSELEILRTVDWSEWKFNFISVEHNYTSDRELIRELLEFNGYQRVFMEISDFDDYYIRNQAG